jgi:hypothetical protein
MVSSPRAATSFALAAAESVDGRVVAFGASERHEFPGLLLLII